MSVFDGIGNAVQSARSALDGGPSLLDAAGQIAGGGVPANNTGSASNYWKLTSQTMKVSDVPAKSLLAIDPFFNWDTLQSTDFRKNFTYELIISNSKTGQGVAGFVFPLAPTSINMSIPIAASVSATMKGIVEDNNGAPFRPIVISGTTGVAPKDSLQAPQSVSNSALDYLFQNTIQAVSRTANSVTNLVDTATGGAQSTASKINTASADEANAAAGSGYVFFHNLNRFLDYYISLKKTKGGAKYRLSFHMHKDQMYFDVLLSNWSFTKPPASVEYQYQINLVAYRRRPSFTLTREENELGFTQASRLNAIARAIGVLRDARKTISDVSGVLAGIRADVNDSFFTPLREIIGLASDTVGLVNTIADFPDTLVSQCRASFEDALSQYYNQPQQAGLVSEINSFFNKNNLFGSDPSQTLVQSTINNRSATGQAALVAPATSSSPLDKVFANPSGNVRLFDLFPIDTLRLTPDLNNSLNGEITRLRRLSVVDIKNRRDTVQGFVQSVSENMGGGNATYNRINGLPPPKPTTNVLTTDSIELLSNLNETIQMMDKVIVSMQEAAPDPTNDYYNFYADYALSQGFSFNTSASKYFVTFPYGASLEDLAVQYLGDVDRWVEIAALNNLKEPYIDEDGFYVPLIGSGSGNQLTIADPSNLYIGAVIFLSSDTQNAAQFKIADINQLSATETVVTVASVPGQTNLSVYQVADNAKMQAFLPGTVNSSRLIAIPSDAQPNVSGSLTLNPTVQDLSSIARLAKVDFLLQSNGDLAFTASGDIRLASGMTNIVQAATMKLMTPLGSLLQHLGYGNSIQAGESVADFNAQASLASLNAQFTADPRFAGVAAAKITAKGPAVKVDLALKIADTQALLPLSANLPM